MDIITPRHNFRPAKPWFKKPLFYTVVIFVVVVYFSFRFGLAQNNITIENSWLWKGFANVMNIDNSGVRVPDPNPMPKLEPDRLDILILGNSLGRTDGSAVDTGALLTDSMMILSFDKKTKKAAMISIPRDLYLEDFVTDLSNEKQIHVTGKINEIYPRGLFNHQGLDFDKNVLSKITGVYIDKAVVFNFDAFKTIIDNIGGIDIHLDKPFTEPTQWTYPFSLPAGDNHLNGDQALYYVRSRYSTNDFDRARRQQDVIKAIKVKAAATGLLSSPTKIISLFSSLSNDVQTDFHVWDIGELLNLANSTGGGSRVQDYFLTTDNLLDETHTASGEYILVPKGGNLDGIKDFFKNILSQQ